jgi:GT2 family glycosyltransferase
VLLDVLIATRERRAELIRTLDALVGQLGPEDGCFVLENGCAAQSTQGLAQRFPVVTFLRSDVNLGATGGRNLLARHGSGEVLVFLDDDAIPGAGLLDGVRRHFTDEPELGLLALRIDDPATGRPRPAEFPHRDKRLADTAFRPTYFVGAGWAVTRAAFRGVGGLDEHLFYSLEELDLSFRLVAAGVRFAYDPALRVSHLAAAGGRPSGRSLSYAVRNRWWVPVRHLPWPMAASHVLLWSAYLLTVALRRRQVGAWRQGFVEGVSHLPGALRSRRVLPPEAVARLRREGGRLWW